MLRKLAKKRQRLINKCDSKWPISARSSICTYRRSCDMSARPSPSGSAKKTSRLSHKLTLRLSVVYRRKTELNSCRLIERILKGFGSNSYFIICIWAWLNTDIVIFILLELSCFYSSICIHVSLNCTSLTWMSFLLVQIHVEVCMVCFFLGTQISV